MASSPPSPPDPPTEPSPAPREERLDTLAAQVAAIDELIDLARQRIQVFDVDLSQGGWNQAQRMDRLSRFLRRGPNARLEIIVHDTRWIEASCARLTALLRQYSNAMTIYRTGPDAQGAMDPLLLVDEHHFLHRFHIDRPQATLAIAMPQAAKPLVTRFAEIWATGEPGLTGTVLGL
jgi:hypothetical protein